MRELSLKEKHEVIGGAVSGALLTGIGNIVKSGLGFINDMYSNIVTTVFLFSHANDYDKLEVKLGSNTIKYDNTSSNKINLEQSFSGKARMLI